jgi:hypothetical protein
MNVYQAIALVSAALALAAGLWDAYRLRRGMRYSAAMVAIIAAGPVVSLWLYLVVTGLSLKPVASVSMLVVGAATGTLLARRASVTETASDGSVRMRAVAWLALPAAFSTAAVQVASAIESFSWMIIALAAFEASVGFVAAAAITLIYRRSRLGRAGAAGASAPTAPAAPATPA